MVEFHLLVYFMYYVFTVVAILLNYGPKMCYVRIGIIHGVFHSAVVFSYNIVFIIFFHQLLPAQLLLLA